MQRLYRFENKSNRICYLFFIGKFFFIAPLPFFSWNYVCSAFFSYCCSRPSNGIFDYFWTFPLILRMPIFNVDKWTYFHDFLFILEWKEKKIDWKTSSFLAQVSSVLDVAILTLNRKCRWTNVPFHFISINTLNFSLQKFTTILLLLPLELM